MSVTNEMISAAHKVTMEHGDIVLSHRLLTKIYLSMDALANREKTSGSPLDEALLRQALEALEANRRSHYYCEDTWYSCPQHEEGCANEAEDDECNCGADEANEKIDEMITALRERLGDTP